MTQDDFSVARNARAVDWLKGEMAGSMGQLFRHMVSGRGDSSVELLSDMVMTSYILARRLGISFEDLDASVSERLGANVRRDHQLERWFGDLSALDAYRRRGTRT